jgi:hypothetical protein
VIGCLLAAGMLAVAMFALYIASDNALKNWPRPD